MKLNMTGEAISLSLYWRRKRSAFIANLADLIKPLLLKQVDLLRKVIRLMDDYEE